MLQLRTLWPTASASLRRRRQDKEGWLSQCNWPFQHPLSTFILRLLLLDFHFKMRWLPAFLSLSLLAGSSLAARKSSEDRFNEFHAKALSSTPVKLEDASYKQLTSAPRDYSVAVLLTALEARYACHLCTEFQPEWELLAHSWTKGDKAGDSRLVFGTLDFTEGKNTFIEVCYLSSPLSLLPSIRTALLTARRTARFTNCPGSPTLPTHYWPSCLAVRGASSIRLYQRVSLLQTGIHTLYISYF